MSDMAALASEHIEEAINLFKDWVKTRVRYTGRSKNANKMAKVLPLFQGSVRDNSELFRINFGCSNRRQQASGGIARLSVHCWRRH